MHLNDESISPNKNDLLQSRVMTLSAHSIQGKRDHMEDHFDIAYQLKPDHLNLKRGSTVWPYEYFYLGIFDGHGGCEASSYARSHLVKHIIKQDHFWSDEDEDVLRAIRDGFRECQNSMRKELHLWDNPNAFLPSTAGTTASVLFIKNGKFYSGHVGDSRIVIVRENDETKMWLPDQLTTDHKPELPTETDRINRAGGEVRNKLGVQRVVWRRPVLSRPKTSSITEYSEFLDNLPKEYPVDESRVDTFQRVPFLSIARSLGDFWSIHPITGLYIVSPEPDVSCRPITKQDKAIMLASDGVWNVLSSCQASRMLQELNIVKNTEKVEQETLENHYFSIDNFYDIAGEKSNNYAKSLVYYAYQTWERKRLRSDNITMVVAMLIDLSSCENDTLSKNCSNYINPFVNMIEPNNKIAKVYDDWSKFGLKKLSFTETFVETIHLDKRPKFYIPRQSLDDQLIMDKLERLLLFPPSIIKKELEPLYDGLVAPKNFQKLTAASYRRIVQTPLFKDAFIYIKHVSDDPADELESPIRINDKGKEVRDSSAQATQNIHDFGQPWIHMVDNDSKNDGDDGEGDENADIDDLELDEEYEIEDDDEDDDLLDDEETYKEFGKILDIYNIFEDGSIWRVSSDETEELEQTIARCENKTCPLKNRKLSEHLTSSDDSSHRKKHHLRCLMNSPRPKYQIETRNGGVKRKAGCDCLEINRKIETFRQSKLEQNHCKSLTTSTRSLQCDIPLC